MMSALALAVMSGPFASVAAAAPLYGYYYCERVDHCLGGFIPYYGFAGACPVYAPRAWGVSTANSWQYCPYLRALTRRPRMGHCH